MHPFIYLLPVALLALIVAIAAYFAQIPSVDEETDEEYSDWQRVQDELADF
jgi:hypothetical protein